MPRSIEQLNFDYLKQLTNIREASYPKSIECFFYNKKLLEKKLKQEIKYHEKKRTCPAWLHKDYINKDTLIQLADDDTFPIGKVADSCFANLWRDMVTYKNRNNKYCDLVIFACKFSHHPAICLSSHTIRKWIELCMVNKMLPKELDASKAINEGLFNVNLSDHHDSMLYIYLSNARVIQEEPAVVAFTIHLIDVLKCNFFLAYVIAESFCRKGSLHSYLDIQSKIASKTEIYDRYLTHIEKAKKLYTFINELPKKKLEKNKTPPTSNPSVANKINDQAIKKNSFSSKEKVLFKDCRFKSVGEWIKDIE